MREVVSLETKGADPDERREVDTAEGVEDGGAGLASERCIWVGRDVRVRADRRDRGSERDDALACFDFGAWPGVPGHTNTVDSFRIGVCHLRRHFCWQKWKLY